MPDFVFGVHIGVHPEANAGITAYRCPFGGRAVIVRGRANLGGARVRTAGIPSIPEVCSKLKR